MTKAVPLKKPGRPKTEIDYILVHRYAQAQCTQEMVASALGIPLSTLEKDEEFRRVFREGKEDGKSVILMMQYKLAAGGNADMLKWLGKNYIKQADKIETKNDDRVTIVIGNEDKDV